MDNERYSLEKAQEEGAKLQEKIKSGEAQTYSDAERLLVSQEVAKSKEGENVPPILCVYRDNSLFNAEMPGVIETLKSLGRKVEIKSFPPETKEEEITKWLLENEKHLAKVELLTDKTSSIGLSFSSGIARNIRRVDFNGRFLDSLFEQATEEAILGRNIDMNEPLPEELTAEAFAVAIQNIIENPQNLPNKVYIITQAILDHSPFSRGDLGEGESIEKEVAEEAAAEKVKQWFILGGIVENQIYIKSAKDYVQNRIEADQDNNWVVVDRHCDPRGGKYDVFVNSAKRLNLPLANFFEDAYKLGLTLPNKEKMEAIVTRCLKEKFEKRGS